MSSDQPAEAEQQLNADAPRDDKKAETLIEGDLYSRSGRFGLFAQQQSASLVKHGFRDYTLYLQAEGGCLVGPKMRAVKWAEVGQWKGTDMRMLFVLRLQSGEVVELQAGTMAEYEAWRKAFTALVRERMGGKLRQAIKLTALAKNELAAVRSPHGQAPAVAQPLAGVPEGGDDATGGDGLV